jgi:anti-sigma factor RsiW
MNWETGLKLQAWVDGEIVGAEAERLAASVERDPELQTFAARLKHTSNLLRGNELDRAIPESREFYWSKIERGIRQAGAAPGRAHGRPLWVRWWARYLAPAAIVGTLAVLLVTPAIRPNSPRWISHAEIESPLDDLSSITFRSEEGRMTVIWVSTR